MSVLLTAGSGGAGALVPLGLRATVDTDDSDNLRTLIGDREYTTPSAVAGVGGGVAMTGLYAAHRMGFLDNVVSEDVARAAAAYGVPSAAIGAYSALRPVTGGGSTQGFSVERQRTTTSDRSGSSQVNGVQSNNGGSGGVRFPA